MRVLPAVAAGLVLASFAASGAAADGLPVLNVDVGASGVAAPGGAVRYVTVTVGKQTIVEATRRDGGQIVRMQAWPGTGRSRRSRTTARRAGSRPIAARSY